MMKTESEKEDMDYGGAYVILDFIGDDLDPAPIMALIPLYAGRPKKKGDPMTRPQPGKKTPVSKTGYCGFSTHKYVNSRAANDHVRYIVEILEERKEQVQNVLREQGIRGVVSLLEGHSEGELSSDVEEALLQRIHALGFTLSVEKPLW